MFPTIDIIIVDFNAGDLINNCLLSIENYKPKYCVINEVVIVNNGELDTASMRSSKIDLPFRVIKNHQNKGFAAACNQGAVDSKAEYLLFLNPDTQLMENSLDYPVLFLQKPESRSVGIVGIQLIDDDGMIARTCSYYVRLSHFFSKIFGLEYLLKNKWTSTRMWDWDHTTSQKVDGVMGAFFFVKRSLFEKLNGFDERFFVYYEEADLGVRARQIGSESYYLASAKAYHKGGGTSEKVKAHRLFYSTLSRIKYGFKHFNLPAAFTLLFLTITIEPITRLVLHIARGSYTDIKNTSKGYFMLWTSFIKDPWNIK